MYEQLSFITRLFNYTEQKVQLSAIFAAIASLFAVTISAISSFSAYVLGITSFLLLLLFLIMIVDYKTGIMASKKEGKTLTSKRGLQWVWKFGAYLLTLSVSYHIRLNVIDCGLDILDYPLKLMHFYVLFHILKWEATSIDENLERLGYRFQLFKLVDALLTVVKQRIKGLLK